MGADTDATTLISAITEATDHAQASESRSQIEHYLRSDRRIAAI